MRAIISFVLGFIIGGIFMAYKVIRADQEGKLEELLYKVN